VERSGYPCQSFLLRLGSLKKRDRFSKYSVDCFLGNAVILDISAGFQLFNKQYLELRCLKKVRDKTHETSFFKAVYHPLRSGPLFLLVAM